MEFIVEKIGMSRTITVPAVPVTLLKVVDTKVCEVTDGTAIVAYGSGKKANKAIAGKQKKYSLEANFNRFATLKVAKTEAGDLDLSALSEAKVLKTSMTTKGRGFAGVTKRHGFHLGRKTHGSKSYRIPGSIGCSAWPAKVIRGKKMPGQYGNHRKSIRNLEIIDIRPDQNLVMIKGAVPGHRDALVMVNKLKF